MTTVTTPSAPTMDDLFVDPRVLPSPSVSVLEIIRRAEDPEVAMADIARLVESDVSVAVQVLRMANSALYSPAREITTIARALAALGLRTVKLLALTTSLRSLIPQQADAIDLGEIRHRMVVTAAMARRTAQLVGPTYKEEAFVAGLLTGIGPVVLATQAPHAAQALIGASARWPEPDAERALLGYSSDDVTVELTKAWGLPAIFVDAVGGRRSEAPLGEVADDDAIGVVGQCLQVATLAEPVLTGRDNGSALESLRRSLMDISDFSEEEVDQWLVEAEPVVADAASMLQFRIPDETSYADLLCLVSDRLASLQLAIEGQVFDADSPSGDLAKRNDELEAEASTDVLTKLPNRRAFDRRIASLMETASPGLGLLVLDLDHFKHVNDTHGHSVGDDVLRMVGEVLKSQTRGDDFTARFGGEEFMMLLPATTDDALFAIAERLRHAIEGLEVPLKNGSKVRVTASLGGATLETSPSITSARALVEAADAQLYAAKQGGRNRTCIA